MSKSNPVYLIGMMGVGKSTVGDRLAVRLGRKFMDTDREVERLAGRRIAEIFETEGEARFRELEADVIEAATEQGAVIALGGGAVVTPGAIERLLERGTVVFLVAEPETLVDRIGDPASRPLLAGLDREARVAKLTRLLADRMPFYARATIQVDAQDGPEEVVERILDALGRDGAPAASTSETA